MSIKSTPCIAAALLLATSISSTLAAQETPSVDLTVIGTIEPESCEAALGGEGVVDYGTIGAGLIQAAAETALAETKSVTLTVTCPSSTTVAFSVTDNRSESKSSGGTAANNFGLGNVHTDGKLGRYIATLRNGKVGGSSVNFVYRTSSSGGFAYSSSTRPISASQPGYQYSWTSNVTNAPASSTLFTADVEISAWLASRAEMKGAITEDVPLDGSMTLTFVTGL